MDVDKNHATKCKASGSQVAHINRQKMGCWWALSSNTATAAAAILVKHPFCGCDLLELIPGEDAPQSWT